MINKEDPKLKAGDFGLLDLNMGYFLPAVEAGWEIVGLPVFSKRKPVYQLLFCNSESAIRSATDLSARRSARALTVRRSPSGRAACSRSAMAWTFRVAWVLQAREVFPVHDPSLDIEYVDESQNMAQRLIAGELDALITDISDTKLFEALENNPKVRRLFANYVEDDQELYNDTGIYTPVHMIVMSRRLDRQHPELAGKFYTAFEKAKQIAYDDILSDRGGFSVVYLRERLKEQMATWGDPWQYGIKANKTTMDAFIRYNVEQGMVRGAPSYEEIFAAGVLDT